MIGRNLFESNRSCRYGLRCFMVLIILNYVSAVVTTSKCLLDSCNVFEGPVDYAVVGNTMSYAEDRSNCGQRTSSSAQLTIPSDASVVKAYLQWSGSSDWVDYSVTLNGSPINADRTFKVSINLYLWFFGAYADVTSLVKKSGTYTVADLQWSSASKYCGSDAAYGGWSLVVVYSSTSIPVTSRIHLCQDVFRDTYPADKYYGSIGCVQAVSPSKCSGNPEFTMVAFEGDDYVKEDLYIEGKYFGNNAFGGSSGPNFDIDKFNVTGLVNETTTSLDFYIRTYLQSTKWGSAVDALFDFVRVLKYRSSCVPAYTSPPTRQPVPAATTPVAAPVASPVTAPVVSPLSAPVSSVLAAPVAPEYVASSDVRTSTCTEGSCTIYEGPVDYAVIGNTMSYDEDSSNCNQKADSSATLNIPTNATVVKAFLQWSGSGGVDNSVTLNGVRVFANRTLQSIDGSYQYYGAYSEVTSLVRSSSLFTVADLAWSSESLYCNSDSAYGAWSMVVVYKNPAAVVDSRVHLCQDEFRATYPANTYSATIGCVQAAAPSCPGNPEMTLVAFEGDNYVGEEFYIGGQLVGKNIFNGSSGPNLDIDKFNLTGIIQSTTTKLDYSIKTYQQSLGLFTVAVDQLFDFVRVLKYTSRCNKRPVATCKDASICGGTSLTAGLLNLNSSDSDGSIVSMSLSTQGPFLAYGTTTNVTLTVTDNNGAQASCSASVLIKDCRKPPTAVCKASVVVEEGQVINASSLDGGSFVNDNATIASFSADPAGPLTVGKYDIKLTVTASHGLTDICTTKVEVVCTPNVLGFELIDATESKSLGALLDTIDYTVYRRNSYNIKASVKACSGSGAAKSVLFNLNNGEQKFCDQSGSFALLGDSPSRKYNLGRSFLLRNSSYRLTATPFSNSQCSGDPSGRSLTQSFRVVGPGGYQGCPGAPVYFELYNAETKKRVTDIQHGSEVCIPTCNITIRAVVVNCDTSQVHSVEFQLVSNNEGGIGSTFLDPSGPEFFMYGGDDERGTVFGKPARSGRYSLKATAYEKENREGVAGASMTVSFSLIDCSAVGGTRRLRWGKPKS